jgi:hypothetical protein
MLRVAGAAVSAAMLIALTGACGDTSLSPRGQLDGSWGGEGFSLQASPDSASVVFDCAYGTLDAPIAVGFDGRFSTTGEYVREVGPVALPRPAVYDGRVTGLVLELRVTVTDTLGSAGTYGPFTGTRGGTPHVLYCP